jgi:glycosyltransferase involved in cell wall biosynthesis
VRVGIDATFIVPGRVGGAEHMLTNLVQGLGETAGPDDEVTVFTDHPWSASGPVSFRGPRGGGDRFRRIIQTVRPELKRFDAFLFANYFTPPFPRTAGRPRFVTVIHDLQYRHLPTYFSRQKRVWLRATHEATLRLADATVAISHDVRRDLLASYGARWADRVHTIHNPVSWTRFGADDGPPPVDGPYVLAVAAQYPHKNLDTLVRAFGALRRRGRHPDTRLVLAGQLGRNLSGVAWTRPLDDVIDAEGVRDAVYETGYLDDAQLGAAYRNAAVFAFPSRFEGFALPVVEALGFGLPVLTTRSTAIPEVTMGLATYLDDPLDADAMAERLDTMLEDPAAFAPAQTDIDHIRTAYAPAVVARRYRSLLRGDEVPT